MKNFNIISSNPIIYTFDKFIAENTRKNLINHNLTFKKSRTRKINASNIRKSHVAYINDKLIEDQIYKNLKNKLHFKLSKIEGLQIQKYEENSFYKPHFDVDTSHEKIHDKNLDQQRRFSIILYLNDDFDGGETYFPYLDTIIKPKTNRVLVFENCIRGSNFPNPMSLHEGRIVNRGKKLILNSWSNEVSYINTFKDSISMY